MAEKTSFNTGGSPVRRQGGATGSPPAATLKPTPPRLHSVEPEPGELTGPGTPDGEAFPGKGRFKRWSVRTEKKKEVDKQADASQASPGKPSRVSPRARIHSSPARMTPESPTSTDLAGKVDSGRNGNSSANRPNAPAAPESPFKGLPHNALHGAGQGVPPWYIKLGAKGQRMMTLNQKIPVHSMWLVFEERLRVQFGRLDMDRYACKKSDVFRLGIQLLAPLVLNGPLTADEFNSRLQFAVENVKPDPGCLARLIKIMEFEDPCAADQHPPDFLRALKIFRTVNARMKPVDPSQTVSEMAMSEAATYKTIRSLVQGMWPSEQERHRSEGKPARRREEKPRPPETAPPRPAPRPVERLEQVASPTSVRLDKAREKERASEADKRD